MPLPSFSWANGAEVWNFMMEKDSTYSKLRSEKMLERHPSLVDNYRTILFDWLSEVSHECKFHRETYHLALDLVDRYLSAQSNVGKLQLQLIGTTCLFLAAKFEEIRPPTVTEFADLTDGACRAEDIIDNEVAILSAIKWEITPMTANNWLNTYMQILLNLDKENKDQEGTQCSRVDGDKDGKPNKDSKSDTRINQTRKDNSLPAPSSPKPLLNANKHNEFYTLASTKNDSFILPAINGIFKSKYKRIASLIDLALLHIESLRFSNSILTASALYHFTDELTVRQCTGYDFYELSECVRWLSPFVETIKEIREPVFVANFTGEAQSTQMHTHIATAKLLDKVIMKMAYYQEQETRLSLKRKACSLSDDDDSTEPENDPLLTATTLLTPPKREPPARRARRVH